VNRLSTVAAGGDLSIDAAQFSNEGGLSGTIERTRIYGGHDQVKDGVVKRFIKANVIPYNEYNNADFPNIYYVNGVGDMRLARSEWVDGRMWIPDVGMVDYRRLVYFDMETGKTLTRLLEFGTSFALLAEFEPAQSQYDPNNLLPLPADFDSLILTSDVEVATATGGGHG
ncbi:hypothetical protein, partial [Thauera sinica]